MHAAEDRSADREADGARRDRTVFGENGFIGEEDARGMIIDGTAVQQLPRCAVGIDRPVADNPRVEKVKALLARPVDLPVRLADEHRLTLMDGDLRWANVNLEYHGIVLMVAREAPAAELTWHVGHRVTWKLRRVLGRILEERMAGWLTH